MAEQKLTLTCPKHKKQKLGRLYLNANFARALNERWETDLWFCVKCKIVYAVKTVVDKPQTLTIIKKLKVKRN